MSITQDYRKSLMEVAMITKSIYGSGVNNCMVGHGNNYLSCFIRIFIMV